MLPYPLTGRLFIDIDTKTDRVDLVVKAVEAAGMLKYATVSSGSNGKLDEARKLNPGISIQARPDSVEEIQQQEGDGKARIIRVRADNVAPQ